MFRSSTTVDEALDEIAEWADSLPGDFSIEVVDRDDATTIEVQGALISSAVEVRASLLLTANAIVLEYRFDVRLSDGTLLWRHDRHGGHEDDRGMHGPAHGQGGGGRGVTPARSASRGTPKLRIIMARAS